MSSLIHCITNYVTMNDVANTCLALGSRPIMAEAKEELEDIIPKAQGVLINMGTPNKGRLVTIAQAFKLVQEYNKLSVLDPVGCHSSKYRLQMILDLLNQGYKGVLKVNGDEAKAIAHSRISEGNSGVDSQEYSTEEKIQLAKKILKAYGDSMIVIVTGKADVVVSKSYEKEVKGQEFHGLIPSITGTGCMLNGVIISLLVKDGDPHLSVETHEEECFVRVIKALRLMKKAIYQGALNSQDIYGRSGGLFKTHLLDRLSRESDIRYLITDHQMAFEQLMYLTEIALKNGVDILQYRGKNKSFDQMTMEASRLLELSQRYHVPLIINDNIHVAQQVGASGVHLGQEDGTVEEARKQLGPKAIIGVTAKTLQQAKKAEDSGADYLGSGALYTSPTKKDAKRIDIATLKSIYNHVSIPVYGIGGMTLENYTQEIRNYTDGIVMVSGIYDPIIRNMNS